MALMSCGVSGQIVKDSQDKVTAQKTDSFIRTHKSCCGGSCGNNSYKMWKDDLICYIKTTKSIDYSIKELTDNEPLHLYTFVKNDKRNNIIIVKLKHENEFKSLQDFICNVMSK